MIDLYVEVVDINAGAKANLLNLHDMLILSCFLLALCLLETELAVVHDAAYRRNSVRCDLHEVKILCGSCLQCLRNWYDAGLIALCVDQSYFLVADLFIDLVFHTANC